MRGFAVALSFLVLLAGSTAASAVEILYFWANDCVHCNRLDGSEMAEYLASPTAKRVRVRKVDVGSYRASGTTIRQILPADLAYLQDRSIQLGGTPRFLIVDKGQVLYNGMGRGRFRETVVPYAQALR